MIILYEHPLSPYAQKVKIALAEKGIEFEPRLPDLFTGSDAAFAAANPRQEVPALVVDDQTAIFDSRVIVEYLDNASPVMKLLPEDTRPRIQARRWEALADGCTDAVVAISMEKRRPAEYQYGEWSARQRGKVERALDAMAEDLGSRTWCCGDFFNLADIAVGCCLGFMELRLPEISWRTEYPSLARLSNKLAQRTSFRDTAPVG